jgi:gluconokinase
MTAPLPIPESRDDDGKGALARVVIIQNLPRSGLQSDPTILILMGVSGSGKSTIGAMLAQRLQWRFADADWFHPPGNIEKMHQGIPLSDHERAPWLNAIASWIDDAQSRGEPAVIACSALKRRYRDILIGTRRHMGLIYLKGSEALIARRIAARHEHFMPESLLRSQFEALEEPEADEQPIIVSIEPPPHVIVDELVSALRGS